MKPDKDMTVEQFLERLAELTDRLHEEHKAVCDWSSKAVKTEREIWMLHAQFSTLVRVRKDLGLEPPK